MTESVRPVLEAALLRELAERYRWENRTRFGNRLVPPVLMLSDATTRLGRWVQATRTLELSRAMVFERPWLEVLSVLEHEMAHQYVGEVLGVRDESPHGETFRRICAERGIDARAAGAPIPSSEQDLIIDRVLERIRKLLALAGSSNQHEAELAMKKAHELMLRHNVEAAATREYEVRHLGDPTKRGTRVEADIAALLAEYFFVKVIRVPAYVATLARQGAVYEIAGSRANVEMAAHVYAFLLATAERLWLENRRDRRVKSGRDRLAYQSGVIGGFRDKLRGERIELKGTGLVWVGDADLDRFYRARHPHITTRTVRRRINSAHAAGAEAGRTVVLNKPIARGPSGTTRLLGT